MKTKITQNLLLSDASSQNSKISLVPWFITGFSDAEACFSILIQYNVKYKTNYRVKAIFSIGLHKKDIGLLEEIQSTLGVGKIHIHGRDSVQFRVEPVKELQVIIDHFDQYPLLSAKIADYILFKEGFNIIKLQEHLTQEGLLRLVGIKASLNLGLPDSLKEAFPKVVSVNRPEYTFKGIADPHWVAGFTSGDGSFNIKITNHTTNKLGSRVQLRFSIGLHIREKGLLQGLATFFNLGYSNESKDIKVQEISDKYIYVLKDSVELQIIKFSDITGIIIPFFEKYSIQGKKSLDFKDFKIVADICKNKDHLNPEGFSKIMDIKGGMNKVR